MKNTLYKNDVISIKHLTKEQIELILQTAKQLKNKPEKNVLTDRIIANCFFEPSTRTRLSFETAALRLGAQTIGFSDAQTTSIQKGESLQDSITVINDYADLIVIRHPQEGAAQLAADICNKPVINAGDGANQHPTQALIDLFSMEETQGKLHGLNVALVGDLKYGRTIHSLIQACSLYQCRLFLVAPDLLTLPDYLTDHLKLQGVKFSFHHTIEEIIDRVDILYMTRIQQERFKELIKNPYQVTESLLKQAKSNFKILHPLPRLNEISTTIDVTEFAYYFQQAANGVFVRQALLKLLLHK